MIFSNKFDLFRATTLFLFYFSILLLFAFFSLSPSASGGTQTLNHRIKSEGCLTTDARIQKLLDKNYSHTAIIISTELI
jgi:hypothetical protein